MHCKSEDVFCENCRERNLKMKEKLRNVALVLLLFVTIASFSACENSANNGSESIPSNNEKIEDAEIINEEIKVTPISGECGSNITYRLTEDGTLTISGTGSIRDYQLNTDVSPAVVDTPWYEQRKAIKKIIVEDGVEKIGAYAFAGITNVKEAQLPDCIYRIENLAFAWCENLENINIPLNCSRIEAGAFEGCKSLKEITLPSTLEFIGTGVFESCTSLKKIVLPNGVTDICSNTFMFCEDLEEVVIPKTVTDIWDYAFSNCEKLEEIVIPDSVQEIKGNAFSDYTTIYTTSGSFAESYAKDNGLKVEIIGE